MFLTVHATSGMLIGQNTNSVWLAFVLGFISHFILDMIPHGDQELGSKKETHKEKLLVLLKVGIADSLIMMTTVGYLLYTNQSLQTPYVIFGAIGALLPDAINSISVFFKPKFLNGYRSVHVKLHYIWKGFTITMKQGLVLQGILLFIFLFLLK